MASNNSRSCRALASLVALRVIRLRSRRLQEQASRPPANAGSPRDVTRNRGDKWVWGIDFENEEIDDL